MSPAKWRLSRLGLNDLANQLKINDTDMHVCYLICPVRLIPRLVISVPHDNQEMKKEYL